MTLSRGFYQKPTRQVALDLLGQTLVYEKGAETFRGVIVETEAYLGLQDSSCHSFHGKKTERVSSLYLDAGHAYIYLIYGMYYCLNVVTGDSSTPEAVLIRALQMLPENPETNKVANGPGKLCRHLGLTRAQDGIFLADRNAPLRIEKGLSLQKSDIDTSARVGLNAKLDSFGWPLRFYIRGNPAVSKAKVPKTAALPDLLA